MKKQDLKKLGAIIVLLIAFADTNLDVLLAVGLSPTIIAWIKLVGLILVALAPSLVPKNEEEINTFADGDGSTLPTKGV